MNRYIRVVHIRDMVHTDLDTVWAINQANVPAVGTETRSSIEEIFHMCTIALVAADDEIRGFCMVLPPGTSYDSPNYLYFCDNYDDFTYLDRVAVSESHQRRGIGPLLYREVERRTTAEWFTLEVNVKPLNEGSLRFHAREGFVEVDQLETRPGKIVSLMVKRLR